MALRKDDPIYYKKKIGDLIKQALNKGLKVKGEKLDNGVNIYFESDNGDIAGITLKEI